MERSGAQVVGESGLGLEHQHRNVLFGERERGEQPDRARAGDDESTMVGTHALAALTDAGPVASISETRSPSHSRNATRREEPGPRAAVERVPGAACRSARAAGAGGARRRA